MATKTAHTETFAEKLQAIIDAAPSLRAAGVTSVTGEVAFTLAPADPPRVSTRTEKADEDVDLADLDAFRKHAGGDS